MNGKFNWYTVATHSRNDGYTPSGSETRRCASTGEDVSWNGNPFNCQSNYILIFVFFPDYYLCSQKHANELCPIKMKAYLNSWSPEITCMLYSIH